jgi:secondary thiamine-phosphate synthase enzyme
MYFPGYTQSFMDDQKHGPIQRNCGGLFMIEIDTRKPVDVEDITAKVEEALQESGIESGICLVYTLHTTTGLTVNEADADLIEDMLNLLESIAPEGAGYRHDHGEGNAHAHLRAILLGNSVIIPVEQNRLSLGAWQRILFLELDGPRRRKICVKVVPDSDQDSRK